MTRRRRRKRKKPLSLAALRPDHPVWNECRRHIEREASYWTRAFQHALTRDDLVQEGWLAVARALRYFDASRGARLGTLLTLILRQHFRRLIKTTLMRSLYPTTGIPEALAPHHSQILSMRSAERALNDRVRCATLWTLPAEQQQLAFALLLAGGKIARAARALNVNSLTMRRRVYELRNAMREPRDTTVSRTEEES